MASGVKMADNLSILEKLNEDESRKFVHEVLDSICEKEGPRFEQYAKTLSLSEYSSLKSAVTNNVRLIAREGLERKKLTEAAVKLLGADNKDLAGLLSECIWVRRDEVKDQLIREACAVSHNNMVDFDWDTKLALASDKLGSLQQPLLSLDVHLNENKERRTENFELSREELSSLVSSLDAANKVVLQLRT